MEQPDTRDEDAALAARIAAGDQHAVADAYDRHAPAVWSAIRSLNLDETACREVTQDVFVCLWRQAAAFDPARASLATWLGRIARARAIDRLRRDLAQRRGAGTALADLDEARGVAAPDDVAADAARADTRAELDAALEELPADQRVPIELAFLDGYSHSEIAAHLNIPVGTIKTRIFRGLARLRRRLDPASLALEDLR